MGELRPILKTQDQYLGVLVDTVLEILGMVEKFFMSGSSLHEVVAEASRSYYIIKAVFP